MNMIKKITSTIVLLSGMLFAGGDVIPLVEPIEVESKIYAGVLGVVSNIDNYVEDTTYTLGGKVLGGYKFTDNIKAEARVGYIYYDNDMVAGADIYIKPQYNGLYTLMGYSYVDTDTDSSSLVYGVGFEVAGVFLDATYRLESEETLVSLGYLYNF